MSVENPSALNLDERLNRLVEYTRSVAEAAEANRKAIVESAEATRKSLEAAAKAAEADRDRFARLEKSAEATAKTALDHRLVRLQKSLEATAKTAEADRDRLARLEEERDKERKASVERFAQMAKAADADRDRFSRLEKEMAEDRRNNEGSRGNISRAMENTFAASLPRAIEKTHGIVIRPEDVRVRVRKNNNSREYDFIAPNGELVLVGEVKIRLTYEDVESLSDSLLSNDFRELFPEYAGMPVYGIVAGGAIDEDAAILARKRGFIIMRMEGGKIHPTTGKKYQPKKF